jgi:hypothetical protein
VISLVSKSFFKICDITITHWILSRYSCFLHQKTDSHDIAEILLKVALNTITLTLTITLNSLNTERTITYDVGNPGSDLGQAQKCVGG